MSRRPMPPGWPFEVTGFPFLFIFVGAPQCWQHAAKQKEQGFKNHLCLTSPNHCCRYQWPIKSLSLILMVFCEITSECEGQLVGELASWEPIEINIRHWPYPEVICHRRKHHD